MWVEVSQCSNTKVYIEFKLRNNPHSFFANVINDQNKGNFGT